MKKQRTIQTRRARPKAGFRILNAATRLTKNRKQRAATTAHPDDLTEVPGVGVARALVVILLLHVAAIAGIYLHNSWSESSDIEATMPALNEDTQPVRMPELRGHTVSAGETYESIASEYSLDRAALERVNGGKDLKPGWMINLPNRPAEQVRPIERPIAQIEPEASVREPSYSQTSRPIIQTSDTQSYPGSRPGELALVEGADPEPTESAVLITPPRSSATTRRRLDPPLETRLPVREHRVEPVARGRSHVVRNGETLWRIAKNNGVTVDALKRANPNVNVEALQIGARLVIPNR